MTKDQVAELIEQIPDFLTPDEFLVVLCTKAAEVEREACAKLFDGEIWAYDYREIAAAIRARGEK